MPILCFLIDHSATHKKILVDCGLRKDLHSYGVPAIDSLIHRSPLRYFVPQSCLESLAEGVIAPNQIDIVFITHCHFDHVGNAPSFLTSQFVVGGDTRELFEQAYPEDPLSLYAEDILPKDRTTYIDDWVPLGPFPRTRDFFGDGSLYLVDAPGHLPGHMNVLARTSADGAWIYLAGDSCYHSKVSTGEARIAEGMPWDPDFCIHTNKGNTEETLQRIQEFSNLPRTQIIFSHDLRWYEKNKGGAAFWPGIIDSA